MNTTIQYMHRTEDNHKTFAQVTVRGELTEEQVFALCTGPHPGWFNPVDLNLEYPDGASAVNLDENPWCEFLIPFHSPSGQKPTRQSADLLARLEETKRDHDDVEDDGGPTAEDLGHAPGEESRDSKLKAVIYTRFSPRPETL